jgi:hypothetical protein
MQLYALISLADKEHMKTKELEVESTFWHAKCDQLTEELESLKLGPGKERKFVERHRRIFQRLKLDITSATCNMCGTGLTQENVYILNRCGAVSSFRLSNLHRLMAFSHVAVSKGATPSAKYIVISVPNLPTGSITIVASFVITMSWGVHLICSMQNAVGVLHSIEIERTDTSSRTRHLPGLPSYMGGGKVRR